MGCLCSSDYSPSYKKRSSSLNSIDDLAIISIIKNTSFDSDYIIGKKIGFGKYGLIKVCYSKESRKKFAVKIIKKTSLPLLEKNPCSIYKQIDLLCNLSHPSIIKIHAFYEDLNFFYIVKDYVIKGDLFERLIKSHHFCETCTSKIMRQIFSALAYLHSRDLVHRDIKLENLLIEETSQDVLVKITDFDTLVRFDEEFMEDVCGSVPYMAPEVITGRYNEKCDVWSAGIAMFTMLTGRYPFTGRNPEEINRNILIKNLDEDILATLSHEASGLIKRLLEKDPNKRYRACDAYRHGWILKYSYKSIEKPRLNIGYNPIAHGIKLWALQYVVDQADLVNFELAFVESDSNLDGYLDAPELVDYLKIVSAHEAGLIIYNGFWSVPNMLNFYEFISVMADSSFWVLHFRTIKKRFPFKLPVSLSSLTLFLKAKLHGVDRFNYNEVKGYLSKKDLFSMLTR